MSELSQEIFREELPNFRSICLTVKEDCSVKLDTQDMGETVRRTWGDSDYEFWLDVPCTEAKKLLFALLRDKYSNISDSVDQFKNFCETNGIKCEWDSYI